MRIHRVALQAALFGMALAVFGAGCSSLKVTHVPVGVDGNIEGLHYYLPKPFLVATPQADGTVNFDIIYLPDKSHEYAIQPISKLSAYTFQASRDEKGFLNQVEYKASTSVVGQQLLSSAGAAGAQTYTIDTAQLAAAQTQIATAQAVLDTANSNLKAAAAALAADRANQPTNLTAIASDQNALAQAQAKLPIAEAALQRAQETSRAVAMTATAGTPGTQAVPTISSNFGQPTWNPPYSIALASRFGPVLYAINDSSQGAKETVTVTAVESTMPGTKVADPVKENLEYGVNPKAQPTFETITTKPVLSPSVQTVDAKTGSVSFKFSQPIAKTPDVEVSTDTYPPQKLDPNNMAVSLTDNNTVLKLAFKKNSDPGDYVANVNFGFYAVTGTTDPALANPTVGKQTVKFTVQKVAAPVLSPANQTVEAKAGSISLAFSQPIVKLTDVKVSMDNAPAKSLDMTPCLAANNEVLNLAFKTLDAGDYSAVVSFSYNAIDGGAPAQAQQTIKFTIK